MKQIIGSLFSIAVLLSVAGCKSDCEPQSSVGSIVGFVKLVSENQQPFADNGGAKVSIDNTSIFAITDSKGKYELKNVRAGTYDITVTKDGFGTYRQFSISYAGGPAPGTIPNIHGHIPIILGQIPTFTISGFSSSIVNNETMLSFDTSIPSGIVLVFFNDGSTVSSNQFENFFFAYSGNYRHSDILEGFSKKKYKMIAYPCNLNTYYYDRETNFDLFTSLGTPTPIIEVTFP